MSATPGTPRSRTPSRVAVPSRLVIPHVLRPTHSLTSLHAHGQASQASPPRLADPHTSESTPQVLDSSASSVVDVDMSGGILVQDVESEADFVEDGNVVMGHMANTAGDESKKNLRDQLRRTLSQKRSITGTQ
jgi:hypothetical protein